MMISVTAIILLITGIASIRQQEANDAFSFNWLIFGAFHVYKKNNGKIFSGMLREQFKGVTTVISKNA